MSPMKSMTGYGKGKAHSKAGEIVVEIQAVNRRHLELHSFLPKSLQSFDHEARRFLQDRLHRGYVTLRAQANFEEASHISVKPNAALALQFKEAWDALSKKLGGGTFQLEYLRDHPELFSHEVDDKEIDAVKALFLKALESAFTSFDKMRKEEGKVLEGDKKARIHLLQIHITEVEARAKDAIGKYRDKLLKNLSQMGIEANEDERILKEIALFADKIDITEELVRFKAHLKALEKEKSGKKLEFILQELGREINTIGSKAQDYEISRLVIEVKSELEKLKEQTQNVE